MRTFAAPFEKRVSKEKTTSSLKRLKTVQEASTEKYNLSRSVNSFERIESVSDKLRVIIYYTMKSLILAQDER